MRRLVAVPVLLAALAAPAFAGTPAVPVPPVMDLVREVVDPTAYPPPCPVRPVVERHTDGTTWINIPTGNCTWIRIQVPVDLNDVVVPPSA